MPSELDDGADVGAIQVVKLVGARGAYLLDPRRAMRKNTSEMPPKTAAIKKYTHIGGLCGPLLEDLANPHMTNKTAAVKAINALRIGEAFVISFSFSSNRRHKSYRKPGHLKFRHRPSAPSPQNLYPLCTLVQRLAQKLPSGTEGRPYKYACPT